MTSTEVTILEEQAHARFNVYFDNLRHEVWLMLMKHVYGVGVPRVPWVKP